MIWSKTFDGFAKDSIILWTILDMIKSESWHDAHQSHLPSNILQLQSHSSCQLPHEQLKLNHCILFKTSAIDIMLCVHSSFIVSAKANYVNDLNWWMGRYVEIYHIIYITEKLLIRAFLWCSYQCKKTTFYKTPSICKLKFKIVLKSLECLLSMLYGSSFALPNYSDL